MVVALESCLVSFYILTAWYGWWHFGPAKTNRQRSYVITLLGSCIMTFCSVPILYRAITSPEGFMTFFAPSPAWTTTAVAFFMTSLGCDLAIGVIFYRNKINLLTGWIHHTVYILLLFYVIRQDLSRFFVGMCILELPTLSLSIGSVFPQYRYDYVFAAFYVPTRIGFHAFMIGYTLIFVRPLIADVTLGLTVLLPLHCYWFYGFILQQKRLWGDKADATPAPASIAVDSKMAVVAALSLVPTMRPEPKKGESYSVCSALDRPIGSGLHPILAH